VNGDGITEVIVGTGAGLTPRQSHVMAYDSFGGSGSDLPLFSEYSVFGGTRGDALTQTVGVMDAYKVRWGVAWYDGLGTRLAIDPTTDCAAVTTTVDEMIAGSEITPDAVDAFFAANATGTQDAMKRVLFGAAGVTGGLATPGVINWLVASARDANLFS
jgi:hypothetical protein